MGWTILLNTTSRLQVKEAGLLLDLPRFMPLLLLDFYVSLLGNGLQHDMLADKILKISLPRIIWFESWNWLLSHPSVTACPMAIRLSVALSLLTCSFHFSPFCFCTLNVLFCTNLHFVLYMSKFSLFVLLRAAAGFGIVGGICLRSIAILFFTKCYILQKILFVWALELLNSGALEPESSIHWRFLESL
jgi:hypothetical protein